MKQVLFASSFFAHAPFSGSDEKKQVSECEPCGSSPDWSCGTGGRHWGDQPGQLGEVFFSAWRYADEAVPLLPRMRPPTWKYAAAVNFDLSAPHDDGCHAHEHTSASRDERRKEVGEEVGEPAKISNEKV
ncbi:hypothetical protein GCK32_002607 [Trichostrongylus colubriformis]|uniref:Uncharacterized protein n=1 Tax=Trichostrongylus colubriformis TaxID=6319 RepID=A0AAN8EXR2_TRICO